MTTTATTSRQRGGSLVEAALGTLTFAVLVFGILEGSFLVNSSLGVAHATRAAARTASVGANSALADWYTLAELREESRALDGNAIVRVVIYRATVSGQPPGTCRAGYAWAGVCNVYTEAQLRTAIKADFGCGPNALDRSWCPTTRRVALTGPGGPPDRVGVYVQYSHTYLTGWFGRTRTISQYSVARVEGSER